MGAVNAFWMGCAAAPLLLFAASCGPKVERLTLEPLVIRVGADGTSSVDSPDPELDAASELQEKGECEVAIPSLERFVEDYPESSRFLEAVYRLGVCEEDLGSSPDDTHDTAHLERARGYYLYVSEKARGEYGVQGALRAAYTLETLGRPDEAAEEYEVIRDSSHASAEARAGARIRRVICLYRSGSDAAAARALGSAMGAYQSLPTPSESMRSSAAEARFAAAESSARAFESSKLDAPRGWLGRKLDSTPFASPQKRLNKRVARKLHAFAVARNAYTDVVQVKDPEWAAAAVYRVGELSEHFYRDLVEAPAPRGLSVAQQAVYAARVEIRAKPFKQSAFDSYLQVIAIAERVGFDSPWVVKARGRARVLEAELRMEVMTADPP